MLYSKGTKSMKVLIQLQAILLMFLEIRYTVLFEVNTPPFENFGSLTRGGGVFTAHVEKSTVVGYF